MQLTRPLTDIMTVGPDVVTDTLPLREAARELRRRHYAGLPVVSESGSLVGVLSYKDILDAFGERKKGAALQGDPLHGYYMDGDVLVLDGSMAPIDHVTGLVRDHMSKSVISLTIDDTVLDAVRLFADEGFHRVPIVDGAGDLVGLVTTHDIMKYIAALTR